MNEGIQIAQRGGLVITDDLARSVRPEHRELLYPKRNDPTYYSIRFMGFFVLDPDRGAIVGQFPHLYPTWIAIAYGINGLSGARWVIGFWSILGLLAVNFAGARAFGRAAAAAGTALLAIHALQVWYGRYPNAEMVMQALVFAGILAFVRAHADGHRLFAPVAALLLGLAVFAHITALFAIAAIVVAVFVERLEGRRLLASFVVPLVLGTLVAIVVPRGVPASILCLAVHLRAVPRRARADRAHRRRRRAIVMWRIVQPQWAERWRTVAVAVFVAAVWVVTGDAYLTHGRRQPRAARRGRSAYVYEFLSVPDRPRRGACGPERRDVAPLS